MTGHSSGQAWGRPSFLRGLPSSGYETNADDGNDRPIGLAEVTQLPRFANFEDAPTRRRSLLIWPDCLATAPAQEDGRWSGETSGRHPTSSTGPCGPRPALAGRLCAV